MYNFFNNILLVNVVAKNFYSFLVKYPTPININLLYNFGALSGFFLVVQILSGFFLTMFYTPHIDYAFDSVQHIMRDVNYGWFLRYMHANGASFFFLVVYVHMIRGLYYGSYQHPRSLVWFSGVIIYLLMIVTAFLGYVLPWGQMSYWAATVITNLVTIVPFVGKDLVYWIWGGYSINNATLNRFYSFHFLLPFVILVLVIYHLYILHKMGSSNPLGIRATKLNKIPFYPYFIVKDLLGILVVLIPFCFLLFFYPDLLGHSDNYIRANPLVTPSHIVPEWYFLPVYGILRSISDKTYGILVTVVALLCFFLFPYLDKSENLLKFEARDRRNFWFFIFNFIFLGFLGSQTPTFPVIELGLICTHYHLFYVFLDLPIRSVETYALKYYVYNRNNF
jgi:ubiquinol-cytochrome c reductase cytochrome b subunit